MESNRDLLKGIINHSYSFRPAQGIKSDFIYSSENYNHNQQQNFSNFFRNIIEILPFILSLNLHLNSKCVFFF